MSVVRFRLNGREVAPDVTDDALLLDVLRELGVRSVREGCGVGQCGACTAMVDGRPVTSCLTLAARCGSSDILTAEGLPPGDPVIEAFVECGAAQCGYCIPGFVLMARSLLDEHPQDAAEHMSTYLSANLCRCGCYPEITQAAVRALELTREGGGR